MLATLKRSSKKSPSPAYLMDLAWTILQAMESQKSKAVVITIRFEDGKSASYEARAPEMSPFKGDDCE